MSITIYNATPQTIKIGTGVNKPVENLPELSNPALAEDILLGKQAIDENRNIITGTYEPYVLPTLNEPAIADEILVGREAINDKGEVIVGTLEMPEPKEDLDAELTEQENALTELEEEIENLGDKEPSKLQIVLGVQDVNSPYTITQADVGDITEIPQYFFQQKTGLVGVDIESIKKIGAYAFQNCTNLDEIKLPNVEEIGIYCFQYCNAAKRFDFAKAKTIGQRAFANSTGVEYIDISNAKTIGTYAMNGCTYLTSVKMEKVETIDSYAFQTCYRLGYIEIPASCTKITNNAFSNVGRATDSGKAIYRFYGDNPPTIYANTFSREYTEKIIVNKGRGEVYKTATNWTTIEDLVEEEE